MLLIAFFCLVFIANPAGASAGQGPEAVVLLHGLARTSRSMATLADRLAAEGYSVSNVDYPSTKERPENLARILRKKVLACCADAGRVHFVTYSMGGIVARTYLAETPPANLGRVVMIAPPNQGSEIVDLLGDTMIFRAIFGPTATTLRTGDDGFTQRLPPPDYEVGIIAGDRPINPVGAALIPGSDDGTVSLEGTKLTGMADFITVHRSHTFIASAPEVGTATLHFLRHGMFNPQ